MQFKTIQSIFFFGFLGISTILFLWLSSVFANTIFWAIFFTIVFYPLYRKILKKLKSKKNWASVITTLIIIVSIIIPVSFTSYIIIDQIPKINKTFLEKNTFDNIFQNIPFRDKINKALIKNKIDPEKLEDDVIKSTKESLNKFSGNIISFSKNIFDLIMNFFLMIYIIFFGLRDGKSYLNRLSKILPLGDKTEKRLFSKFSSIVRSIFKGTLIVSVIQGLLASILLWLIGFKGLLIWITILIISAMIPAIGVGLVLVPSIGYLFITGEVLSAFIVLFGMILISLVDNILRPYLIGHETEIPDMLITISILAGLSLIGVTGLVIGPVIAGFFLTMWHLFEEKYHDSLDNNQ